MQFPISDFPQLTIRDLPSSFEEVSTFYNTLNPDSCYIYCQHEHCLGYKNQLPLTYNYSTNNPTARCKVCYRCVQAVPSNDFFFFFPFNNWPLGTKQKPFFSKIYILISKSFVVFFWAIFKGLKGDIVKLNDCLNYLIDGAMAKDIKKWTQLSKRTIGTLKLRVRATMAEGRLKVTPFFFCVFSLILGTIIFIFWRNFSGLQLSHLFS